MSLAVVADADFGVEIDYATARESVDRARGHVEGFWQEVKWQVEHGIHEALGYKDFDALWEAEYAKLGVAISRGERPELVGALRAIGQTQEQIAGKLGVSRNSVIKDLNVQNEHSPEPVTNSRGQSRPASYKKKPPQETRRSSPPRRADDLPDDQRKLAEADLINGFRSMVRSIGKHADELTPKAREYLINDMKNAIEKLEENK